MMILDRKKHSNKFIHCITYAIYPPEYVSMILRHIICSRDKLCILHACVCRAITNETLICQITSSRIYGIVTAKTVCHQCLCFLMVSILLDK